LNEFIALFIHYFFINCYVILLHGTIDREVKRMGNAMDGGACHTITLFHNN
jgi:hypothetical protein